MTQQANNADTVDSNLVIDDEYVLGRGTAESSTGEDLEKSFDKFLKILDDIADRGIVCGSLHEATVAYRSVAGELKGQFESFGNQTNDVCKSLITSVDDADQKLYDR
ncbi:hypothetical protein OZX72_08150 [Bifidobacterium sp. ESL0769]|uniref:hypothetical protein n=1 Tax=Bifidobacterium sp. ESL0769 TaxID=2983229 RepID=UPI0023F745C5|nr:hypothetical protein [Bifidobacterium sp. ESL0769]WEV67197.1 hypothetical protein OZX72_08150 [Bifidobacterium sp. ESL0769]